MKGSGQLSAISNQLKAIDQKAKIEEGFQNGSVFFYLFSVFG
jgi:hypothetical protein